MTNEAEGDDAHRCLVGPGDQHHEVNKHELHHHGDAADDVDVRLGRAAQNPVPGNFHQTEEHSQHRADADGAEGNGQCVPQAGEIELPAVGGDKRQVEAVTQLGKLL